MFYPVNWVIIGTSNGLLSVWHQSISWTNSDFLKRNFNKTLSNLEKKIIQENTRHWILTLKKVFHLHFIHASMCWIKIKIRQQHHCPQGDVAVILIVWFCNKSQWVTSGLIAGELHWINCWGSIITYNNQQIIFFSWDLLISDMILICWFRI